MITCNKDYYDEIKKLPTLYFKSNELEYIFELTYKDLFAINGDIFLEVMKRCLLSENYFIKNICSLSILIIE